MPGRNDRCPCGSGQKYKKCCWKKDQNANVRRQEEMMAAALAPPLPTRMTDATATSALPPAPPLPPRTPTPFDIFWKQFQALDVDERWNLVEQHLDDPEVMDDEGAFEILLELHTEFAKRGERPRFAELLAQFRRRRPDLYEESLVTWTSWLIEDALADGRLEELPLLCRELAEHAADDIDIYNGVVRELEYHGRLDLLVEMARTAWPTVKDSSDIMPHGIHEFAERGVMYEVFSHIDRTPAPSLDADLLARIKFFFPRPRLCWIKELLEALTGKWHSAWSLDELRLEHIDRADGDADDDEADDIDEDDDVDDDEEWAEDDWEEEETDQEEGDEAEDEEEEVAYPGRRNVQVLTREFLSYLHDREGMSWTRADMAGDCIYEYLCQRHEGELNRRESMLESAMRGRRPAPKFPAPKIEHPLCPDGETLDCYLGGMFGIFAIRGDNAAAFFQAIPGWLRFLEARGLIDAGQQARTRQATQPLLNRLAKLYEDTDSRRNDLEASWQEPASIPATGG